MLDKPESTCNRKCTNCMNFIAHFFCKNSRQGVATVVGVVSIVGLIITTILSSSLNPWLPISCMSILFASCMGLFCCNKPSPRLPREETFHLNEDGELILGTIMAKPDCNQQGSSVSVTGDQNPQTTTLAVKSLSYPNFIIREPPQLPAPTSRTPVPSPVMKSSFDHLFTGGPPIVYKTTTVDSVDGAPTIYQVIIPPTYQQATCHYFDYGVV